MKIANRMMNLVCIQNPNGSISRIRHVDAEELVNAGRASYVPCRIYRERTTHDERVANSLVHSYRRKKGAGKGKPRSSRGSL